MNVALVHYSGPPIAGGVEQTLRYHGELLAERGFNVHLIIGRGESFHEGVVVSQIPELFSRHPSVQQAKVALDEGHKPAAFQELRRIISRALRKPLSSAEVVIVHNALTLHKNLALTAALWDLLQTQVGGRWIGWHHDLAWARPQYSDELHPGFPWDLLRRPWPGVTNVVVSTPQAETLASLYRIPVEDIYVIPPGFDPAVAGRWTATTRRIVQDLQLLRADAILLLPARLTRRKNIKLAIKALSALRGRSGADVRLLVSGPPGPHNPENRGYLEELNKLAEELNLGAALCFLAMRYGEGSQGLDRDTMANLYDLADGLLFPSRQEGFGIPLLEAAWERLPIFCSDIPPFRIIGGAAAHLFPPDANPEEVAALIENRLLGDEGHLLRRAVRQHSIWDRIVDERIIPLLTGTQHETQET